MHTREGLQRAPPQNNTYRSIGNMLTFSVSLGNAFIYRERASHFEVKIPHLFSPDTPSGLTKTRAPGITLWVSKDIPLPWNR